jgi:hypothetical protein
MRIARKRCVGVSPDLFGLSARIALLNEVLIARRRHLLTALRAVARRAALPCSALVRTIFER